MTTGEYIKTMDGDLIIKHDKWYVSNEYFRVTQCKVIDKWCRDTFGGWRHDNEVDEGWWLQSQEEHTTFKLTWYDDIR